jgi:hypothetical protein
VEGRLDCLEEGPAETDFDIVGVGSEGEDPADGTKERDRFLGSATLLIWIDCYNNVPVNQVYIGVRPSSWSMASRKPCSNEGKSATFRLGFQAAGSLKSVAFPGINRAFKKMTKTELQTALATATNTEKESPEYFSTLSLASPTRRSRSTASSFCLALASW